ncbi:MAG: DNA alkylation repair protein [Myxococcales bacterium]|nr:DNA alkylation repair protein [Myxococcales bacterium]
MEAFKHRISRASIEALAQHLAAAPDPAARALDARRLCRDAARGLEPLELKARVDHVATALAGHLPAAFPAAARWIRTSITRLSPAERDACSMWVFWPLCTFVERQGLAHPGEALKTMKLLTRLASCEFAIRPYLERDQEGVLTTLRAWARDPDPHVRRLVSEGARPRLPWGTRLRALQQDPRPAIPLLDALYRDPELYVRRSVANHVGDIAKDHPALAVEITRRWCAEDPSPETRWVARHGLRALLKRGHAGALATLGYHPARCGDVALELGARRVRLGGALELRARLVSRSAQELMIDYAVHHVKANGELSAKVFKWTKLRAAKGQRLALTRSHALRPISTRRYYSGLHRVELLVNGRSMALADFTLVGANAAAPGRARG